jgi:hypothetical protein
LCHFITLEKYVIPSLYSITLRNKYVNFVIFSFPSAQKTVSLKFPLLPKFDLVKSGMSGARGRERGAWGENGGNEQQIRSEVKEKAGKRKSGGFSPQKRGRTNKVSKRRTPTSREVSAVGARECPPLV